MSSSHPDVVVVGGGTIGLSVAWRAAQAGLAVTVCDPKPGRGATWAAAGMLAPVTEVTYGEEALLQLNLASAAAWPSFAAELAEASGEPVGYRRSATLVVARDADDNTALDDLFAFQQKLGLDVQRLRSDECRRLEPGLAPRVRGGILAESDHQVDNRMLVRALLAAGEHSGVDIERARAAIEVAGDAVRGVTLDDGRRLEGGLVVLAAGADSARIEGLPDDARPPVRPVKGQLLHLFGPVGPTSDHAGPLASHNIRGRDVYVVPRGDGRVVVGATVEELGWDRTVTAGAVYQLLRDAYELLPGVTDYELVETIAGLRPTTPDNAPLLGRGGLERLVVATGHFRNGVLLTPITASAITELLTSGRAPGQIAPFDPCRFGGPS